MSAGYRAIGGDVVTSIPLGVQTPEGYKLVNLRVMNRLPRELMLTATTLNGETWLVITDSDRSALPGLEPKPNESGTPPESKPAPAGAPHVDPADPFTWGCNKGLPSSVVPGKRPSRSHLEETPKTQIIGHGRPGTTWTETPARHAASRKTGTRRWPRTPRPGMAEPDSVPSLPPHPFDPVRVCCGFDADAPIHNGGR